MCGHFESTPFTRTQDDQGYVVSFVSPHLGEPEMPCMCSVATLNAPHLGDIEIVGVM